MSVTLNTTLHVYVASLSSIHIANSSQSLFQHAPNAVLDCTLCSVLGVCVDNATAECVISPLHHFTQQLTLAYATRLLYIRRAIDVSVYAFTSVTKANSLCNSTAHLCAFYLLTVSRQRAFGEQSLRVASSHSLYKHKRPLRSGSGDASR